MPEETKKRRGILQRKTAGPIEPKISAQNIDDNQQNLDSTNENIKPIQKKTKNVTIHLPEEYSNRLRALKLAMGEYYLRDVVEYLIDDFVNKQSAQQKQKIKQFELEYQNANKRQH